MDNNVDDNWFKSDVYFNDNNNNKQLKELNDFILKKAITELALKLNSIN